MRPLHIALALFLAFALLALYLVSSLAQAAPSWPPRTCSEALEVLKRWFPTRTHECKIVGPYVQVYKVGYAGGTRVLVLVGRFRRG